MGIKSENNLLVSIVVITYNSSQYVLETLESTKAQTYRNVELIVSDDGSADNTVEICNEWLKENSDRFVRTELLTQKKNTGTAVNANRGFSAAKGEWIKPIAGDDMLLPDCITAYIEYAENNPQKKLLFSKLDIVGTTVDHMPLTTDFWEQAYKVFSDKPDAKSQYDYLLHCGNFAPSPSAFINRKTFIELGKFDEQIRLCEDHPFWLKATKKGYCLTLLPATLCRYRTTNDSVQISNPQFVFGCRLLAFKYIDKVPLWLFSLIVSQIDQLSSHRSIKTKFYMRLLSEIALLKRKINKLNERDNNIFHIR